MLAQIADLRLALLCPGALYLRPYVLCPYVLRSYVLSPYVLGTYFVDRVSNVLSFSDHTYIILLY